MDEEAGISKLPAPILHHILCFLSQEDAVRTCVLSKSWRHLGSTRPKFCLNESYFGKDKEKFMNVLKNSLQVYSAQNLCIEDFSVTSVSMVDPELVSLLEELIPIVIHVMSVKMFYLSLGLRQRVIFNVPSAVFESESLQEVNLQRCNLSQINNNSIGGNNNKHLKTLILRDVSIDEEETFAKFLSSCTLIERLCLKNCKGLRTINMHNHHNLKSLEICNIGMSTTVRLGCNYFPALTCLRLTRVSLSDEWFNSFSRNFPCLEELRLYKCNGFREFKISSRSIKNLNIAMDETTIKVTIDAPSTKEFHYDANISQPFSFRTTSSGQWDSQIRLSLDLDASLWFLKISEVVAALSQSRINSLLLWHLDSGNGNHERIEHLSDISGSYKKMPVAIGSLDLLLDGRYCDSFFSDILNGLFRIVRPREIKQVWYNNAQPSFKTKRNEAIEFLSAAIHQRTSAWQQDIEEVSFEWFDRDVKEWHPVEGTVSWSEYVAALRMPLSCMFYDLRFRLKWRESDNSFDKSDFVLNLLFLGGLLFVLLWLFYTI